MGAGREREYEWTHSPVLSNTRDLPQVPEAEFQAVRDRLHHLPRETLGDKTQYEVFVDTTTSLIVTRTN